ncbi:hypothetical protein CA13_72980 [Planctomycetes bacterium CA13]|uniref:Uncharacterized protein n=1 Tax=Novipirellula herctigrandis TaxID=2527986 RepID=A0A5C5YPP6_9BACT|nr:hypothetical protein CA13_72980 [Planctomycetes bacterium CA13]
MADSPSTGLDDPATNTDSVAVTVSYNDALLFSKRWHYIEKWQQRPRRVVGQSNLRPPQ